MKKAVVLILVIALCVSLCACNENTLSGKYVSESGNYTVEFEKDGTCTWYQSTWYQENTFFEGTYKPTDSGWQLNIKGSGLYKNTVFIAEKSGKNLIITGGVVSGELFIKQ